MGDKNKGTIKVKTIYQDRGMNWDRVVFGNPDMKYYPARVGAAFNAKGGSGVSEEYSASALQYGVSSTVVFTTAHLWKFTILNYFIS